MTHNYTKLGTKQNMNWDSTRIVLNWIRLSTLSAWIYTVFPSMLHTLNFTSTQLWSKFTSLPLPDLSCLSHSCTPGFLRMLTWGQWLSPWRLILQAIVLAVRPKLWNRPKPILHLTHSILHSALPIARNGWQLGVCDIDKKWYLYFLGFYR